MDSERLRRRWPHAQWGTLHPQLRDLEASMVRVQSQDIDQMEQWYRKWYGSSGS